MKAMCHWKSPLCDTVLTNNSVGVLFDLIQLSDGSHCLKQQDSWSCKAGLTVAHVLDTKINAGSQETSACAEMEVEMVPFH